MSSESEMQGWRSAVDKKLDFLRQQLDVVKRTQAELKMKSDEHEEMLETCRNKVQTCMTRQRDISDELKAQKERVESLGQGAAGTAAPGLRAVEGRVADMQDELKAVETRVAVVEKETRQMRATLDGVGGHIEGLTGRPVRGAEAEPCADGVSSHAASGRTNLPADPPRSMSPTAVEQLPPQVPAPIRSVSPSRPAGGTSPPRPRTPVRITGGAAPVERSEELALKKAAGASEKKPFVKAPASANAEGAKVLARFTEGAAEMCFRHLGDDEWLDGVVKSIPSHVLVELTQPRFTMYTPDGIAISTALEDTKTSSARFGPVGSQTKFKLIAREKRPEDKLKKTTQGNFTLFATAPSAGCRLEHFAKQHAGKIVASLVLDEARAANVRNPLATDNQADGTVVVYTLVGEHSKMEGKAECTKTGRVLINIDPDHQGHQLGLFIEGKEFRPRNTVLPDKHCNMGCPEPPAGAEVTCELFAASEAILASWELASGRRSPARQAEGRSEAAVRIKARLAWRKGDGGAGLKGLTRGTTVTEVKPGSPACKAGLQPQLVQLSCDTKPLAGGGKVEEFEFKVPDGVPIKVEVGKDASGLFVKPMGGAELLVGPNSTSLRKVERVAVGGGRPASEGQTALATFYRSAGKILAQLEGAH